MKGEQQIREFLLEAYQVRPDDLAVDTNLIEAGIVDSSGILELIDFLETEFSIMVSDEEIADDHFETIQNILNFIESKQTQS